ncbi:MULTISPECIES: TetR/AcrR family transcriptional regulator [Vagococcus]|uniref:Transcriptional regulator, TetR family n=1 Tax=Vagococcus fluvialis bH819 TaxID=1255619 RepID=A0A1X6WP24_9ENTE|nr:MULTISPECIES: TetR/AcrR family transcriptional regulator [Vagococcus]SLM86029.1 Transcriptional regulator, TetR family [Vagococcus fluvialis bH819]
MKQRYDGEQTKEEILMTAGMLFNKYGYKKTSIPMIVNQLDGLTKGAIYYHFNSKEAILDELMRHFMPSEEVITNIRNNEQLNGLEKIQELFLNAMFHQDVQKYLPFSPNLTKEPLLSLKYLKITQDVFIPEITYLIKEGNQDKSLDVIHPETISEIILFLLTTWYNTTLFTNSLDNFYQKMETSQYVLEKIGINILDEKVLNIIKQQINQGIEEMKHEESTKN